MTNSKRQTNCCVHLSSITPAEQSAVIVLMYNNAHFAKLNANEILYPKFPNYCAVLLDVKYDSEILLCRIWYALRSKVDQAINTLQNMFTNDAWCLVSGTRRWRHACRSDVCCEQEISDCLIAKSPNLLYTSSGY